MISLYKHLLMETNERTALTQELAALVQIQCQARLIFASGQNWEGALAPWVGSCQIDNRIKELAQALFPPKPTNEKPPPEAGA
jgi:hypothetical protein